MKPEDLTPEQRQEFARQVMARLPESLRFIAQLPPLDGMDARQLSDYAQEYLGKIRANREQLIAHGINADKLLAETQRRLDDAIKAFQEFEEADDIYLHKTADLADAKHELFKKMDTAVKQVEEENPFHPEVQDWREQLEELRKQMPKE